MKSLFIILSILLISTLCTAQIDTINTQNNKLIMDRITNETNSYLVYFQNDQSEAKFNMEIWDRTVSKADNQLNVQWNRSGEGKTLYQYDISVDAKTLEPIEEIIDHGNSGKKHFIYAENQMHSHADTSHHNGEPTHIADLKHSFNWELDLETFALLPLENNKQFAISFYHPGSSTPPQYYKYSVTGESHVSFNHEARTCWILTIKYSENSSADFWIDQTTHRVLKMKEVYGNFTRFKLLLPQ